MTTDHFRGKDALAHVQEKRHEEIHGRERKSSLMAFSDASKETALLFLLLGITFHFAGLLSPKPLLILGLGWVLWQGGITAWRGWFALERLHRTIEQERFEIEHHRKQEREELKALYQEKGFEGKLLDDVVDVLMADDERLLKVMLEEEMGLTLESYEHPLKQGCAAILGTIFALLVMFGLSALFGTKGFYVGGFVAIALTAIFDALLEKNRLLSSLIWNVALAVLAAGMVYFLS